MNRLQKLIRDNANTRKAFYEKRRKPRRFCACGVFYTNPPHFCVHPRGAVLAGNAVNFTAGRKVRYTEFALPVAVKE